MADKDEYPAPPPPPPPLPAQPTVAEWQAYQLSMVVYRDQIIAWVETYGPASGWVAPGTTSTTG
jgi:hypothetical protein